MMAKGRKPRVPEGMPVVDQAQGGDREMLSLWFQQRLTEIENENLKRVELLRTVGEHPSPVFANIVRLQGQLGMPKSLVAKMLGITPATLMQHYRDEYDLGTFEAIRSVAANAMRIASSPAHPDAARVAIQILDRRGGEEWAPPTKKVELKNDNQVPLIDASKLTREERKQLRMMLTRVAAGGEGDPPDPGEGMDLIE